MLEVARVDADKNLPSRGMMCDVYLPSWPLKKGLSEGRDCLEPHIELQAPLAREASAAACDQMTAIFILELKTRPAICSTEGLYWTTSTPGRPLC